MMQNCTHDTNPAYASELALLSWCMRGRMQPMPCTSIHSHHLDHRHKHRTRIASYICRPALRYGTTQIRRSSASRISFRPKSCAPDALCMHRFDRLVLHEYKNRIKYTQTPTKIKLKTHAGKNLPVSTNPQIWSH